MSDLDCVICSACCSGCVCLGSCMTLAFGCPSQVKLDKEQRPLVCPECDDVAVFPAKSYRSMRCFFLRVTSFGSEKMWVCDTCDWHAYIKRGEAGPESAIKYPGTAERQPATHQPFPSREMNASPNAANRPSIHQPSQSRGTNSPPSADPGSSIHRSFASKESNLPNVYEMSVLPAHTQSAS